MGKNRKSTLVLGYTRSGHAVLLPACGKPSLAEFVSWTTGDHLDASRILVQHGERLAADPDGSWCMDWAEAHRAVGKRSNKRSKKTRRAGIRGGAEVAILSGRRR